MSDGASEKRLTAYVRTYGCQQNVADSEKIKGILEKAGYALTDDKSEADLIVFNTCAVREHAQERVFGNVGALKVLKKNNPNLIIVLCGCMMEQEHIKERIKATFPFVDIVFGTNLLHKLPEFIEVVKNKKEKVYITGEKTISEPIIEDLPIKRDKSTTKAFLSIMYGCDNFCSYCIVPHVRGRERSREYNDIMSEAKTIIDLGYKDITLLGQNVNSYGKGLRDPIGFPELLNKISMIPGEFFLRFMTSHPKDATKELFDVMSKSDKICNHIHLPFQSGSDRILKLMNRKYTREKYLDIIKYAKEKMSNISITSDVIIGFPGETYEDFQETVKLVKEVKFTSLFTFIYSPREGTRAAQMKDDVRHEEKVKWFNELLEVQKGITNENCEKMIGSRERVLVEKPSKAGGYFSARTQGNMVIELESEKNISGQFIDVEVTGHRNWTLKGKIL